MIGQLELGRGQIDKPASDACTLLLPYLWLGILLTIAGLEMFRSFRPPIGLAAEATSGDGAEEDEASSEMGSSIGISFIALGVSLTSQVFLLMSQTIAHVGDGTCAIDGLRPSGERARSRCVLMS